MDAVSSALDSGAAIAATESPRRRIWLCADDYGISPAVNDAIRRLIADGRLNATSVMVNTPSFTRDEALSLAMLRDGERRIAVGLHLTLTAPFRPTHPGYRPLVHSAFPSIGGMLWRGLLRRLDGPALAAEIAAQFAAFIAAFDRPPDFVDGHQHVHLIPQVSEAVLAATAAYAPQVWVRQCGRTGGLARRLNDRKGLLLDLLSRRFRRLARRHGLATNPAFAGTYDFATDKRFAELFPGFLDGLPDGGLIMCHPGVVDAELVRLDPLTTRREQEFAYLASEAFANLLSLRKTVLM